MEQEEPIDPPKKEKNKDKEKKKKKKPSRTAETMYRTTMANHIRLSEMADQKAGLMVSINSIIISIMTSFLVHEYASNPKLLMPIGILVLVCLITITFALLATKPSVKPKQAGSKEKLDLLFFGDYTALSLEEYKKAMKAMVADEKQLNESLIENIYAQGKVIDHKFKLLSIAYRVFMYGFPVAIVSFLLMLLMR
jgi:Family of unknown function (DUF5706)